MYLEFPATTVDWCVGKLSPLFRLRSAPKTRADREHFAAAVLRIAHPELVELRCLSPRMVLEEKNVAAALLVPVTLLEGVRINRPGIGTVNPLNWLICHFIDTAIFFPESVVMRRAFADKFPCADGQDDLGKEEAE